MILNKLKTAILGCIISIFLVSCSSNSKWTLFPEAIKVSELDGGTEINMAPAQLGGHGWLIGKTIQFSLYKSPTMGKDSLELSVWIERTLPFEVLDFDVDGQTYSFEPSDDFVVNFKTTGYSHGRRTWSIRKYELSPEFIRKIIEAEEVIVRVEVVPGALTVFTGNLYEGIFSDENGPSSAKNSFQEFLAELEKLES